MFSYKLNAKNCDSYLILSDLILKLRFGPEFSQTLVLENDSDLDMAES